jgi:hypothetical protein
VMTDPVGAVLSDVSIGLDAAHRANPGHLKRELDAFIDGTRRRR